MSELDPVLLARIQFAFTVSFHILFPSFTIGLSAWLLVLEAMWLRTGKAIYLETAKHWSKIFAVSFGMGVVSGIVMSYEFGTNWSVLSHAGGNIIGPLMAYEVLTAFFLEAGFLGIMLFGWNHVPKGVHLLATACVAFGTLISAFWILSANSWLQTPAGYEVKDGVLHVADWWDLIFNPSFPYRLMHMVTAAYLTTSFCVGGIGAWYLLKGRNVEHGKVMLGMALSLFVWAAPLQLFLGDAHGLNTLEYQPAKVAALEAHWENKGGSVPLILFAIPDNEKEMNHFEISLPHLGSLILTHHWDGEIKGLKEWAPEDRPNPVIPFFAFRIMVGCGLTMIALGLIGAYLWLRGKLFTTGWYLRAMVICWPIGFIAVLAGWFTTEVGRQPWVVYGILRTADAVSPVPGGSVLTTIILFVVVYGFIFGAGLYYMAKLVRQGPEATPPIGENEEEVDPSRRPLAAAGQS